MFRVFLRTSDIFGLTTGESSSKMGVSEESSISLSIHGLHERRVVGSLAERRQLLLAETALSACDLEADYDSVALLELGDILADSVHLSAELVP